MSPTARAAVSLAAVLAYLSVCALAAAGIGGAAADRRGWLLLAIGVLYVFSIPWYREAGAAPSLVLGLPD